MSRLVPALGLVPVLALGSIARADTYEIYVAARGTEAATAAEAKANGTTSFWFPKMPRAIEKAVELLGQDGHDVRVMVAQGQHPGLISFPAGSLKAPKGKLQLLGGYCPNWATRDPFGCPTEIICDSGRPDAFFSFGGNKNLVGTLVLSGFIMDAGPSNKYDARSNSLLKGTSRTIPILALGQVVTDRLIISDNFFINGAHRAFELYHSPMSKETTALIKNNFFVNTVIPTKFFPALYKGNLTKSIDFVNNSLIANWPYNPDATSSNVGAVELYHKDAAALINMEGNLFAYNAGGAMQHDWPTSRMSKHVFKNNLFFMNATLFGDARPGAGFFVGKFGPNPRHIVVELAEHMEDDYPYEFAGNVAMDPKVAVSLAPLLAADSSGVQAKPTVMNDLRGMFGVNKDGGTVAIANYAPRMQFDAQNLPFPQEEKAKAYGVQRGKYYAP